MNKEELEALEELKSRREYFEYQPEGCNWCLSFDQWEVEKIIDVILNVIQKQEKENKELKEENEKSLVAFANLLKEKAMLSKDIKELIRDYSIPKGKGMRVMKYDNVPTFINKLQVILNYYNEEI